MEELTLLLDELEARLSEHSMDRPDGMDGIPVGIPYSEYESYYDQIIADEDSCVYVAVHKLNDAISECRELLADCEISGDGGKGYIEPMLSSDNWEVAYGDSGDWEIVKS